MISVFLPSQSELCEKVMKKLKGDGTRVVAVSQNQFYRENLPHEDGMTMPNYDHPGMPSFLSSDQLRAGDCLGDTLLIV